MSSTTVKNVTKIPASLIAPCGINCGVCLAHLRARNPCAGCNTDSPYKPNHCFSCRRKNCDQKPDVSSFCFDCSKYPCTRLKKLDQLYITKYGMSPVANLNEIKNMGLKKFMKLENTRWVCEACGSPICGNDRKCYTCGKQYPFHPGEREFPGSN